MSKSIKNTDKYRLMNISCFNGFKIDKEKEKPDSFHETIKNNKNFLFNFLAKQSYFKEDIFNLQRISKGALIYQGFLRQGLKGKSPFIKAIIRCIQKMEEENEREKYAITKDKPIKLVRNYSLPPIVLLRKRKKKADQQYKIRKEEVQKAKELKKKYIKKGFEFTTISLKSPCNICKLTKNSKNGQFRSTFCSLSPDESYLNSNNSSLYNKSKELREFSQRSNTPISNSFSKFNLKNKKIKYNKSNVSKTFSRNFNSSHMSSLNPFSTFNKESTTYDSNFFQRTNNKKFNFFSNSLSPMVRYCHKSFIIDKCKQELKLGSTVGEQVNLFNNKINKCIQEKLKKCTRINNDQMAIEDKGKRKNKYKKLEEKNLSELKKKMNAKISDVFAYQNRKGFHESLRNNENADEYDLFLKELNLINFKLQKNKEKERQKIDKIETLLDNIYKGKEFLKDKIRDHIRKFNIQNIPKNFIQDEDYFLINQPIKEEQKGTLIPKLMSLREECLKKIVVGNNFGKK